MNGKQARKIRKAMLANSGNNPLSHFATSSSYVNGMLVFKFTHYSIGAKRLYKMGKKIFSKYGFLPTEKQNGLV